MNVIVVNKRNVAEVRAAQDEGYRVVYVGKGSVLANPFHGQENSLDLYRKWLWRQMQAANPAGLVVARLRDDIVNGKKYALECWCAPNPCHADIIKAALDWAVDREVARQMGAAVPVIEAKDVVVATKTAKKGTRVRKSKKEAANASA